MTNNTQPSPSEKNHLKRLREKNDYATQTPCNILNEACVFNIAFSLEHALTPPQPHASALRPRSNPKTITAATWLKRSYLALKRLSQQRT
jgi:hypothetical protein